jgi:hypothetical protein
MLVWQDLVHKIMRLVIFLLLQLFISDQEIQKKEVKKKEMCQSIILFVQSFFLAKIKFVGGMI